MHVILHLAVSQDGFIARSDGASDWVSMVDEELFMTRAREAGCLVVGRTTFNQYHGVIYPVSDALNIVLTNSEGEVQDEKGVVAAHSPEEAISIAQKQGLANMLIAGGAKVSKSFLDRNLVNEVFLSVHPIQLGEGMVAFEDFAKDARYVFKGERDLPEGVRELNYVMV